MSPPANRQALLAKISDLYREAHELRCQLATLSTSGAPNQETLDVLVFRVGKERGALPLDAVSEAVRIAKLTPLPEAVVWVPGLLNLRGQSIPVIDAKAQLTQRARKPRLSDVVIVCSDGVRPVGLLVQEVVGAHRIATNDIEQTPDGLAFAPYLLGIIRPEQTPTLLISIEAVVARSNLPEEEP